MKELNTTRGERNRILERGHGVPLVTSLTEDCNALEDRLLDLLSNIRMSLADWIESVGALRDGARIAFGAHTWTVRIDSQPEYRAEFIQNDDTDTEIDLGTCAALPAAGWRVVEEGT